MSVSPLHISFSPDPYAVPPPISPSAFQRSKIGVILASASAAASSGEALTIGDYIRASEPVSGRTQFAAQHRQAVPRSLAIPFTEEDWSRYTAVRLTARQDASPASGKFPLLVGVLREVSVALMSEYFASHGYVVAFVQPPVAEQIAAEGLVLEALVIGQHVRDMEIAIPRLRSEPWVETTLVSSGG